MADELRPGRHIVVFPLPAAGRVIPFMTLARQLACQGCSVSFIFLQQRRPQAEAALARGGKPPPLLRLVPVPFEIPAGDADNDSAAAAAGAAAANRFTDSVLSIRPLVRSCISDESLRKNFASLMEELQPDCILSCEFMNWVQDVCVSRSIPHWIFCPMPATILCLLLHFGLREHLGLDEFSLEDVKALGPYPVKDGERNLFSLLRDSPDHFPQLFKLHRCAAIFSNSFQAAEEKALTALQSAELNPNQIPIVAVGPLLPEEFLVVTPEQQLLLPLVGDEELDDFLSVQQPASVLYICFGSLASPSEEEVHELAAGLEASMKPFLWMLNSPDADKLLPDGFLERTKGSGIVTGKWVPQLRILSHPAIGAYMTHCGWNSSVEAMSLGVPVITKPYKTDQYTNSWLLVDQLGMGISLCKDGSPVSKATVEECIRIAMEDSTMAGRARRAKDGAANAFASNGERLSAVLRTLNSNMN